jgi:hypothetical protein
MGFVGLVLWWWALGVDGLEVLTALDVPAPVWAVTGILMWIATSPFRGVAIVFVKRALSAGKTLWFFARTCAERYRQAARIPVTQAMSPGAYAWGLVGLSFHMPAAVLRDYSSKFGSVGLLCLKWIDAYHYTLCGFAPDAVQTSWDWSCVGTKSCVDAAKTVAGRTGDFLFGVYLVLGLLISLGIYVPRILYDLVEGVRQGWKGVAVVLTAWNAWTGFTGFGVPVSCVIIGLGCYSPARCATRRGGGATRPRGES